MKYLFPILFAILGLINGSLAAYGIYCILNDRPDYAGGVGISLFSMGVLFICLYVEMRRLRRLLP